MKWVIKLLLMILTTPLSYTGPGPSGVNQIAGPVKLLRISSYCQSARLQAGPETCKETQKHEWEGYEYADKMEKKVGY